MPAGVRADPRKQAADAFYQAAPKVLFVASVRLCKLKNTLPRKKVDALLAKPELVAVFAADDEAGMTHALQRGRVSSLPRSFLPHAATGQADLSDLILLRPFGTTHSPIGFEVAFGGSTWETKMQAVESKVFGSCLPSAG